MISHVKLVSIPVTNQSRSLEFYQQKLGFELIVDEPFGNGTNVRWIELKPPEGQTRVVLLKTENHDPRLGTLSNIVFTAEDVEDTYFRLKVKGVPFKEPPTRKSWGMFTQFSDPDGNVFVLTSS